MASAAALGGGEPTKIEKKPVKFSNLLRKRAFLDCLDED